MKTIHIDDELYNYIASQTKEIGESASDILRRLLLGDAEAKVPSQSESNDGIEQKEKTEAVNEHQDSNVFDLLNKEEVATQKGAVGRFLFILSVLHRVHAKQFHKVLNIKGRERNYFGQSEEELNQHGHSIKPKHIEDSAYWVVTNNNTPRKKLIINEVAMELGYTSEQAEKLRDLI
jgi:negative modulator of initiation of replication